jgi:hypothetical protein
MASPKKKSTKRKTPKAGRPAKQRQIKGTKKKKAVAKAPTPTKATKKRKPREQKKKASVERKMVSRVKTLGEAENDPLGACSYVDNSGQNVCEVTTQSQCTAIAGSKFIAGGRCN